MLISLLTVSMAAQSVGVSCGSLVLGDLVVDSLVVDDTASDAMSVEMSAQMDDMTHCDHQSEQASADTCCAEQDCNCHWGCASLMSTPLTFNSFQPQAPLASELAPQVTSTRIKNLYRPPIVA